MKTLLMALAGFALLPFALPAILVCMVVAAAFLYWFAPVLWAVAAIVVIVKLVQWYRKETASDLGMVGMGDRSSGVGQLPNRWNAD